MRHPTRVVLGAIVLGLALSGCGGDDIASGPAPGPSAGPSSPAPSASPEPSAPTPGVSGPTPGGSAGPTTARAVYWIGGADERRGPWLYREFVSRPDGADPVRDAVEVMLAGEALDPDYTSLWADGTTVLDVRREGTTAVVDLSAQARTNGGGSAFEAATLQQLVHTVTAADPSLTGVQLLVDGQPVETLWGATSAAGTLVREPALGTLAPVWIDVQEGGAVEGEFGGTASVFEATVQWQLRQGDRVVDEGFTTASVGAPERGTWSTTADVPPGDYDLWAYEESAEDGSRQALDSKRVTIG